jgi:hypothetical protein
LLQSFCTNNIYMFGINLSQRKTMENKGVLFIGMEGVYFYLLELCSIMQKLHSFIVKEPSRVICLIRPNYESIST